MANFLEDVSVQLQTLPLFAAAYLLSRPACDGLAAGILRSAHLKHCHRKTNDALRYRLSREDRRRGHKNPIVKRILQRLEEYHSTWRSIEEMGAVLKDPRAGLLDFYGQVDGKLVWLCWRVGETEITHYHALDEGFSGRREIRTSAKHRLIN